MTEVIYFFVVLFLLFAAGIGLWYLQRRRKYNRPLRYSRAQVYSYRILPPFEAQKDLATLSAKIQSKVPNPICCFVHGTFVGADTTGLLKILEDKVFAFLPGGMVRKLSKFGIDAIMRDIGNFDQRYLKKFEHQTGIEAQALVWNSGNHHMARLRGACEVLDQLQHKLHADTKRSLILVGHSHAGQVFALMSHLMGGSPLGKKLARLAHQAGYALDHAFLKTCRSQKIYFITLGSPVAYPWFEHPNFKILHVVNHRRPDALAGDWKGILKTQDGDYIQQLGLLGTDLWSPSRLDREINAELDKLLGRGFAPRKALEAMAERVRVSPFGTTYLYDYGDQGGRLPNFLQTGFGHAVYTRAEKISDLLQIFLYFLETDSHR